MNFSSEHNTRLPFGEYMIRSWCDTDVESLQRHANNRNVWLNLRDVFPHPYTIEDARGTTFAYDTVGEPQDNLLAILGMMAYNPL
jgi:hypothetical protein